MSLASDVLLTRVLIGMPRSMWDLWWTKWHWDRFFYEYFVFPCQFHSTGAPLNWKIKKTHYHLYLLSRRVAQ
jgi:hypothetical protein